MKICERTYSSFHKWYETHKKVTFHSVIINVPPEVLKYLNEDGIILPLEAVANQPSYVRTYNWTQGNSSSDDENDGETPKAPSFPEFSNELKNAIKYLGGHVFIKGIRNAPTDSSWIITDKNLKCSSIEDIYLLLKSSTRIQEDFSTLKSGDTSYLVLKKWEDIHPSTEFRCFVYNRMLIAITQRDCSAMHSYICDSKMDIIDDITKFYQKHLKDVSALANYNFDCVRMPNGKVILVDIGINNKETKPYLFKWDELEELMGSEMEEPEFRYIASETGVQPTDMFAGFCVPYELSSVSQDKKTIDSLISMLESQSNLQKIDDEEEEETKE